MALTFNGKVFRNLQEQVQYITLWLSANSLANEMGIKTLGRVDSEADLPVNDPDHPFQYGDAYMVGEEGETPYRMSIWTRDSGDGNPGWFDIGYFPTAPDQFSLVEINGQVVHIFDADTKLDKVTTESTLPSAYVKNADGTQGLKPMARTVEHSEVIVLRAPSGAIYVPQTPATSGEAASKSYVDKFLKMNTESDLYMKAYGKSYDGTQVLFNVVGGADAVALTIPYRAANGQLAAPNQTTYVPSDDQYISKRYADAHYASGVTHYIHQIIVDVTTTSNYQYKIMVSIINSSNTAITGFRNIFSDSSVLSLSVTPLEAQDDEFNAIYWSVSPYYGDGFPYSEKGLGVSITPSIGAPFIIDGLSSNSSVVSTISIVDTVSQL